LAGAAACVDEPKTTAKQKIRMNRIVQPLIAEPAPLVYPGPCTNTPWPGSCRRGAGGHLAGCRSRPSVPGKWPSGARHPPHGCRARRRTPASPDSPRRSSPRWIAPRADLPCEAGNSVALGIEAEAGLASQSSAQRTRTGANFDAVVPGQHIFNITRIGVPSPLERAGNCDD
jgi:hypothetical protein